VQRLLGYRSRHSFVGDRNVTGGKALNAALHQRALPELSYVAVTPAIKYLVKIVSDMHGICSGPCPVTLIPKGNVDNL